MNDSTLEPSLPEAPEPGDFAAAGEPFELFETWLKDAERHEPNDPNAMALATVDEAGRPNLRMVLLKAIDPAGRRDRGFVFYTNFESRKGEELAANPRAAATMLWHALQRQVRVEGPVSILDDEESDAYFASRPRGAQIGAVASPQSNAIASRDILEQRYAEVVDRLCTTFAVDNVDALWDHLFEIPPEDGLAERLAAYFDLLRGETPTEPIFMNACYSTLAPDYAISINGSYRVSAGVIVEVMGSGAPSPLDAPDSVREAEYDYARGWYRTVTNEMFG